MQQCLLSLFSCLNETPTDLYTYLCKMLRRIFTISVTFYIHLADQPRVSLVIQHFKMQQWELLWAPLKLYFPKKVPISRGNLSKIHRFPRLIGTF